MAEARLEYSASGRNHPKCMALDQLIPPDRWLANFEKIAIRDQVRPLILKEDAVRLEAGVRFFLIRCAGRFR